MNKPSLSMYRGRKFIPKGTSKLKDATIVKSLIFCSRDEKRSTFIGTIRIPLNCTKDSLWLWTDNTELHLCNNLKAKASIFFLLSSSFQLYWSPRFQVVMKGQPNFSLRCKNGTKLIKPSGKCLSEGQHVVCFFPILQILTGPKN